MPITSPVDFISGPSTVSTPGKRAKGNTASFTARCFGSGGLRLKLLERLAGHDARRDLGDRQADDFGDEGHRARGARIDLEHVDLAVLDRVLHVHQPADVERERQRARLPLELGNCLLAQRMRRQRAGGIAGMNAGFLDVLHDAGDEGVLAVGETIDVDFGGIGQIAVDQQRAAFGNHKFAGRSRSAARRAR